MGQSSEGAEPGAQCYDQIGFFDSAHCRLGTAIAYGTTGQFVAGREGVVMKVAIGNRGGKILGQYFDLFQSVGLGYASTGKNHGIFGSNDEISGCLEVLHRADSPFDHRSFVDFIGTFAIEHVPRYVQMRRTVEILGHVKTATGQLCHPFRPADTDLVNALLFKHGHLVYFLETTGAEPYGTCFRCNDDYRGMGPVSGGHCGNEISRARTVLADACLGPSRHPCHGVGRMAAGLFMGNRNEPDTCIRKKIERIHKG